MAISEREIDRWLERGSKFFKAVARNSAVREALSARGLIDEELEHGWAMFTKLHGFGGKRVARAATKLTAAAKAISELDAWDGPNFAAARVVLDVREPAVAKYLFERLQASVSVSAVSSVARFLDRIAALRAGTLPSVPVARGRAAVKLLALRKILDEKRESELRALIEVATRGARPDEMVAARPCGTKSLDAVAQEFVDWLKEWREIARLAFSRRDYRISLGLAQRRRPVSIVAQGAADK